MTFSSMSNDESNIWCYKFSISNRQNNFIKVLTTMIQSSVVVTLLSGSFDNHDTSVAHELYSIQSILGRLEVAVRGLSGPWITPCVNYHIRRALPYHKLFEIRLMSYQLSNKPIFEQTKKTLSDDPLSFSE